MEDKIIDFYKGYEGEREIHFIRLLKDGSKKTIKMWDGHYSDFMEQNEPEPGAKEWTSLALHYHTTTDDWEPWEIPNLIEALQQLRRININKLRFAETSVVLKEICNLLAEAIENQERVLIVED